MFSSRATLAVVWLSLVSAATAGAQDGQPPARAQAQVPVPTPEQIVRTITIDGAKELSAAVVRSEAGVREGAALPATPERIAERVRDAYRDEGYTFARVTVTFDADSGALAIAVDEGAIDGVSFEGVEAKLAHTFADEFALRAGDIFNSRRARKALDVLLRQTRGAVRAGRLYPHTITGGDDLTRRRGTFDLVDRDGKRILLVGLRESAGTFRIVPDLGEREDWFTSVDGFVPSLGMGIAVFDHDKFNHAFVAGHISYKFAGESVGYALGFERPLFERTRLFVGGELHDLTATDDQWQVSSLEASLAAIGAARSFRDYYRRRGVQINSALRVHPNVEALLAWRSERQEPLRVSTDFSVFNNDDLFRPNNPAADGHLNAVVFGASVDSLGFERESLEASYRRHQLEAPFGERLGGVEHADDPTSWRVDWTSEVSAPDAFGSDFDFTRHIVTGRVRTILTEHQVFAARAIGGWSTGLLPPQRQFAIGGLGSVHGYDFKEQIGDTMALVNLEYELGWQHGLKAIGFFDAGRVTNTTTLLDPRATTPWLKGVGFGFGISECRIEFGYRTDDIPSSLQVFIRLGRSF
jgi:hypothetical protein